jgi:hypothetical protein
VKTSPEHGASQCSTIAHIGVLGLPLETALTAITKFEILRFLPSTDCYSVKSYSFSIVANVPCTGPQSTSGSVVIHNRGRIPARPTQASGR